MPSVGASLTPTTMAPGDTALTERVAALESTLAGLTARLSAAEARLPENRFTLCLVSGDFERVTAGLMMANMAASLDMEATIFFAFWGVQAIRKGRRFRGKASMEKVLAAMVKSDIAALGSQRFNMGGLGPLVFTQLMKNKGIATPAELLATARDVGVTLQACTTSMDVFGLTADELLPGVTCCGASQFVEMASRSAVALIL